MTQPTILLPLGMYTKVLDEGEGPAQITCDTSFVYIESDTTQPDPSEQGVAVAATVPLKILQRLTGRRCLWAKPTGTTGLAPSIVTKVTTGLTQDQTTSGSSVLIDVATHFNIDNTGATDVTAEVTSALNTINGDARYKWYGTFRLDTQVLVQDKNIYLDGQATFLNTGLGGMLFRNNLVEVGSGVASITNISTVSTQALNGQITMNAVPTGVVRGSTIFIQSDDTYSFPQSGTTVYKGELHSVLYVSGNNIIVKDAIYEIADGSTYTTNAKVYLLPDRSCFVSRGITFENPNFETTTVFTNQNPVLGVECYTAPGVDAYLNKQRNTGIQFYSCYAPVAKPKFGEFDNTQHVAGGYSYGLVYACATRNGVGYIDHSSSTRHVVDIGCIGVSGARYRGRPRHNHNTIISSSGALGAALSTHEGADKSTFRNGNIQRGAGNYNYTGDTTPYAIYDRGTNSTWIDFILDGALGGFTWFTPNFNYGTVPGKTRLINFIRTLVKGTVSPDASDSLTSVAAINADVKANQKLWINYWDMENSRITFPSGMPDVRFDQLFQRQADHSGAFRIQDSTNVSIGKAFRANPGGNMSAIWLGASSSLTIDEITLDCSGYSIITSATDQAVVRVTSGTVAAGTASTVKIGKVKCLNTKPTYIIGTATGIDVNVTYLEGDAPIILTQTVTFNASTMVFDYNKGKNVTLSTAITANITTLPCPINFPDGHEMSFKFTHDTSGTGKTIAWGKGYKFHTPWVDATNTEAIAPQKSVTLIGRCEQVTTGTAQAGGASTITLAAGASSTNAMYDDLAIEITAGTGKGQVRDTSNSGGTSYVGSTRVLTVTSAWTTQPDSTSVYRLFKVHMRGNGATAATTWM